MPHAAAYAVRMAPGVLPFFLFVVLRQSLQSMHRTAPILVAIVVANLVNAALNWVLIFGHFGAPGPGRDRLGLGHDPEPLAARPAAPRR